jgi:hypothetical protein
MGARLDFVTVLVGNSEGGTFDGFKARFEGEQVTGFAPSPRTVCL